jgi:uncharacterized protein involved in type VI secretion and phage assembly
VEGHPDQPVIVGSVYNAEQMPPYQGDGLDSKHKNDPNVSGIKSNTSLGGSGFNEFRFDDTKDKEQIFLHAERNLEFTTKNDSLAHTYHNRHQIIGQEKDGLRLETSSRWSTDNKSRCAMTKWNRSGTICGSSTLIAERAIRIS